MPITETLNTPSRGSAPATFSADMDLLLSKLPNWTTQANALEANVNAKEASATSAASTASAAATSATASASSASSNAGTATTAAGTATTQAGIASSAATAAAASAAAAAASAGSMTTVEQQTHAAAGKGTPADSDEMALTDSAASWAIKKITFANLRTWIFAFVLGTVNVFTKAQRGAVYTLTDASTIAIDLSQGNNFEVVLGGNRTLGVPTNAGKGQMGFINVWQDATGSRTLAYSWFWGAGGGATITLTTTKCAKDMLAYSIDYYDTGTFTVTIATPGVFTKAAHGYISGQRCQLSTTGALPTGLAASTTYFVRVIDANTFNLCTSLANVGSGTYIATSGSQSGVHTIICGSGTLSISKATP